ncbi:DNA starvation/stationary phase protection protein [Nonomuraea bangladeshensis]|jgi:starvation-inducible DNA-binding protein|uniref:DNA starvation/stationary phase protection protein n=1 Tax=Nonomuraea bangladeshensis TaxID=404385 RepID=A0ABV3GZ94_9ACTN
MATIKGPLSDDARNTVAECLQGALIDLIDLSLVGKQAHWNLVGSHFRSVHLQLDQVVALARTHMDTLAERAVALGINPDGRAATVAKATKLAQLESGWLEDGKVVATITDCLGGISKRMYERIQQTEEADPVTQDLLIAAVQEIDKQHWMFQAMT